MSDPKELADLRVKELEIAAPRSTLPSPPIDSELPEQEHDTGRFHEQVTEAQLYTLMCQTRDLFDHVFEHMTGRLNGLDVDALQAKATIANGLSALTGKVDALSGKVDSLLAISRRNEANITLLVEQYRAHGQRLGVIEANPRLSLVPDDDSDPLAVTAQEAE